MPLTKADNQESLKPPVAYKIIPDPNIKNVYQKGKDSIRWFNNEMEKKICRK